MGEIPLNSTTPIIYQPIIGKDWFTEDAWTNKFNAKYSKMDLSKRHQEFANSHATKIAFFFKTKLTTEDKSYIKYENNLMMALATLRNPFQETVQYMGKYLEINSVYRFGFYNVNNWADIKKQLADDDHIKIFMAYELPVVWLGDVESYPDLLDKIKTWLLIQPS
tara:strand:+ start:137 stop:631 length:495 start_codon:yes stop_codon:yes gene_type:complete